ncbi:amidohydrolase [Aquimarina sp. 2201CG1-2-11]|uniref:amidohydrolase n=1 Tax=Aquimarina discodermiae TaxID=3231043 RepID=UPI003462C8FB
MNPEIIKLRKELHQNPELSGNEYETVNRIKEFITSHHPTHFIENIGNNGLAAVYTFPKPGTTITIRCELDALPIEEENEFDHRSQNEGVSHKCGHDGHMAIVAGLVFWIKKQKFKSGKIVLLFQPAEETGKGAFEILSDQKFKQLNSDYIFALHNIPGAPLHSIITMKKGFSAEVVSFVIHLTGKKSHAAQPENGINPALVISDLIKEFSTLNVTEPLSDDFAILTPVHITMGEKAYGISPAMGELHYTIRTWNTERMDLLKKQLQKIVKTKCMLHNLTYTIDWFEYFPASQNDHDCNKMIYTVAKENNFKIIQRPYPFRFGEDFGWFAKHYKTAMFGLGSGVNSPALHHSNYDFPDEIIETGIKMFTSLIEKTIHSETHNTSS